MYTTITARVIDQTLQLTNVPKIASGGEYSVRLEAIFNESWDGYGKTAVFYLKEKANQVYHVVMADDVCIVPREVLAVPGHLCLSIRGVSGNTVRPTETVTLSIVQGPVNGLTTFEPLPDVYKQVLSAEGANAQAIKVERSRIDNLLANNPAGDAELQDVRVGADGETYPNAGTAVRIQMDAKAGIYDVLPKRPGKNLFDKSAATTGFYLDGGGLLVQNANFFAGDYMGVMPGEKYTISPLVASGAHICFYDHTKAVMGDKSIMLTTLYNSGSGCFTVPAGAYHMRISCALDRLGVVQLERGETATPYESYHEYEPIVALQNSLGEALRKEPSRNMFNKATATVGVFLNGTGEHVQNADSFASDFIPVAPNTEYVLNTTEGGGRYVCFYTREKERISGVSFQMGSLHEKGSGAFITPDGAGYVRFSTYLAQLDTVQLEKGTESTEYEPYYEYKPLHDLQQQMDHYAAYLGASGGETLTKSAATMNAGAVIEFPAGDVKKNKRLSFYGKVGSFSGLRLGHGLTAYGGSYIEIDSKAVKVYRVTSEASLVTSADHGLTISGYISVVVNCQNNADIIVTTGTGTYKLKGAAWSGCNGTVFAASVGSVLTDCRLSWCCSDTRTKAWVFGDSYIGLTSADRFGKHVLDAGFTEWLASGYPGAGAAAQVNSFRNLLALGLPKYAAFLLGMNNPDSGAVDTGWKNAVEAFVRECEARGIVPVLATIPSVPGRDHTHKNAYVRASGHRFIDWEKAVGAHESTSWYAGMLSTDKVHPTELGARALAGRFISDFPEIML